MSVSKYAYDPSICDGDICVGDCDLCDKPKIAQIHNTATTQAPTDHIKCEDCLHNDKPWYEEPCDGCCQAHCGFEQNVSRYIDESILVEKVYKGEGLPTISRSVLVNCVLPTIPTADVRENVKGEWLDMERIEESEANVITEWQQARCSVCGKWHTTPYMYFFTYDNFCPNCGAEMRCGI